MTNETNALANILMAALDCARVIGYNKMTRREIAEYAGRAPSAVSFNGGEMPEIRDAVMELAVKLEDLDVLAQGLAHRHPIAVAAPGELKREVVRELMDQTGVENV